MATCMFQLSSAVAHDSFQNNDFGFLGSSRNSFLSVSAKANQRTGSHLLSCKPKGSLFIRYFAIQVQFSFFFQLNVLDMVMGWMLACREIIVHCGSELPVNS